MLGCALRNEGTARPEGRSSVVNSRDVVTALPLAAPPPLGIPPHEAQSALQQDAFKELINKIAWALGSTYRQSYNTRRSPARQAAVVLARETIREHGYPLNISK